jgi:hypothetical protein
VKLKSLFQNSLLLDYSLDLNLLSIHDFLDVFLFLDMCISFIFFMYLSCAFHAY